MTVLRQFWCAHALLGIASGVILADGPRHTEGDYSRRELVDWNRGHSPALWDACEEALSLRVPRVVFGSYVIRYRAGTDVRPHPDGDHRRIVCLARASLGGGHLVYEGRRVDLQPGDAAVFAAERIHEVTRVDLGERWILTMGAIT